MVPRLGAMRPCQQVFENGLVHLLGAGARTSTHTGHIHEGTPCRFPARMPIEAGDRHNRGNTPQMILVSARCAVPAAGRETPSSAIASIALVNAMRSRPP